MPETQTVLGIALRDLAALATGEDREQIAALHERLDAARLRVLVAGEAKRGKSTLVNALLGTEVLPAGVTPLTAVATTVRHGAEPHVQVQFADGREEMHPLEALPEMVTERGNPANRRRITNVTVYLDSPVLAAGVELVDTPGTGSVFSWDTDAARAALKSMDAAVFVLTADPPVSAAERELLSRVRELSVTTFTVLNKADYLTDTELAEAAGFTRTVIGSAAAGSGRGDGSQPPPCVYPMSARAALGGHDAGFDRFAADFAAYLQSRRHADLALSGLKLTRRIASSLLDEVMLTRRAAQMRAGDAADRVGRFSARLAQVAVRGRDAAVIADGAAGRLLFALNDAADKDARSLSKAVTGQLEALLKDELQTVPAAELEQRGRESLVNLTLAAVGAWREQQREVIEEGLAEVDARLAADLTAELEVLRESAAELMDLDLAVPEPGRRLTGDRGFFFTTAENAGQTELLAGAIRRSLPGELGRRRARAYLRQQAPGLVSAQVGRARADLQYRLREAARELAVQVQDRYTEATGRMTAALRAAEELRDSSAGEAGRHEEELAGRERVLRGIAVSLEQAGEPASSRRAGSG